jgi:predicted nucleic acid-binding protein
MSRYVIDARTLLYLMLNSVPVHSGHQLVAPNLIRSQALALLLESVRRAEMTEPEALGFHDRMTELKMRLLGDRVSRRVAWDIAVEHGWDTTYDAEYLAVTRLQADAFITVDPEMRAKAKGVVPLEALEALLAE